MPSLAVIKSIEKQREESEIFFIGSRFGLESKLIPKTGIRYYGISAGKFRRYHKSQILNVIDLTTLFKNVVDFWRFLKGVNEARTILLHEKPDVLFAKGGYVSLPVALAAKYLRIPVVNHESDSVMGLANIKISKFSEKVCVSFPKELFTEIDEKRIVETGNPIRDDVMQGNKTRLFSEIKFDEKLKTILVLGGSQGSLFINEIIIEAAEEILNKYQLIMVAGDRDADLVLYKTKSIPKELKNKLKVYGFLTSEIADVYAAADLVISRAGSNVLFELAALGKPALLVPHDVSPGGHQFENARIFSRSGAAYLFKQDNLSAKKLFHQINFLLEDEKELNAMSEKMKALANTGAADNVARVIIEVGERAIEKNRENKDK